MLRLLILIILSLTLLGRAGTDEVTACIPDREKILSLDYSTFDHDPRLGWRSVADRPECRLEAADLLRAYHERLQAQGEPVIWETEQGDVTLSDTGEVGILYWHEGQLRAFAGQTAEAVALFRKSLKPAGKNYGAWNQYALGSIAFLEGDLQELKRNANVLQEYDSASPNLRVLQRMIHCFGTTYAYAYSNADCTPETASLPDEAEEPGHDSVVGKQNASSALMEMESCARDRVDYDKPIDLTDCRSSTFTECMDDKGGSYGGMRVCMGMEAARLDELTQQQIIRLKSGYWNRFNDRRGQVVFEASLDAAQAAWVSYREVEMALQINAHPDGMRYKSHGSLEAAAIGLRLTQRRYADVLLMELHMRLNESAD